MLTLSPSLLAALDAGDGVLVYVRIANALGIRLYAAVTPSPRFVRGGVITYNGQARVGDGSAFGAASVVIDLGPYLQNVSAARESLAPAGGDLFAGATGAEIPTATVTLLNSGGHFSEALGAESWLFAALEVLVGTAALPLSEFAASFRGVVTRETLSADLLQLEASA